MLIWKFDTDRGWEYENGFYLTSDITRVPKLLAHYELYKKITSLPGDIIEFGVYKGVSFSQWLTFREILENPFSRKVVGFDVFGTFPSKDLALEKDKKFVEKFEGQGGPGIPVKDLQQLLDAKGFKNYELVPGNIMGTLPEYLEKHPERRYALMHFDFDVYEPTKFVLEKMSERLVPGGIMVFDDYGTVLGETKAVDEFFLGKRKIMKLPISHIPAYIQEEIS